MIMHVIIHVCREECLLTWVYKSKSSSAVREAFQTHVLFPPASLNSNKKVVVISGVSFLCFMTFVSNQFLIAFSFGDVGGAPITFIHVEWVVCSLDGSEIHWKADIPVLAVKGDVGCGGGSSGWNRLRPMHLDPIKARLCLFPLYGCLYDEDLGVENIGGSHSLHYRLRVSISQCLGWSYNMSLWTPSIDSFIKLNVTSTYTLCIPYELIFIHPCIASCK